MERFPNLSPRTKQELDRCLPPTWSRSNPVDIIGDAPPERYAKALEIILDDPENDAVLILNCPTGVASSKDSAQAVIDVIRRRQATHGLGAPCFQRLAGSRTSTARGL